MSGGTLASFLADAVATGSERVAIRDGGRVWSYAELWRRSGGLASALLYRLELRPGERVGILGHNDATYLAAYFGILRAGCVAVPLNQFLLPGELTDELELVGASACLIGQSQDEAAEVIARHLRTLPIAELLGDEERPLPPVEPAMDATILLTSGTTGSPKGAVHTHATMGYSAAEMRRALPFAADDVMLCFLPFFAALQEQLLPTLFAGGALDVLPRFDVAAVEDACPRVTTMDAVPTLMARLLDGVDHTRLAHLHWLFFASEPMPPALLARWWEALPEVRTYQIYGMTETLTITAATPELMRQLPHSVGRPFPGSTVSVVDDEGQPLPAGEAGEVVCASPARMRGYLPEGIDPRTWSMPSGAMRTGDLGRFDDEGRLILTGRIKDIIISGGMNIAPSEIEAVAADHPRVASAVVVGIPDARWGETPVVLAVPKSGAQLTAAELIDHCRDRLAPYKRPRAAVIVDDFPMTGIGKSAKARLREEIISGRLEVVHGS